MWATILITFVTGETFPLSELGERSESARVSALFKIIVHGPFSPGRN